MKTPNPFERQYIVRCCDRYLGPSECSWVTTVDAAWSSPHEDAVRHLVNAHNTLNLDPEMEWTVEHIGTTGPEHTPTEAEMVYVPLRPDQVHLSIRNNVFAVQHNQEPSREIHERETFEVISELRLAMGLKNEEVTRQAA